MAMFFLFPIFFVYQKQPIETRTGNNVLTVTNEIL